MAYQRRLHEGRRGQLNREQNPGEIPSRSRRTEQEQWDAAVREMALDRSSRRAAAQCQGKEAYRSEHHARRANRHKAGVRIYRCPSCQKWHVGGWKDTRKGKR